MDWESSLKKKKILTFTLINFSLSTASLLCKVLVFSFSFFSKYFFFLLVKHTLYKISHLAHFMVYSSVVLKIFVVLSCYHKHPPLDGWNSFLSYEKNYTHYRQHCCSVTQLCPTLCNPMDCNTPGFLVLHHLPEFAQTHVH